MLRKRCAAAAAAAALLRPRLDPHARASQLLLPQRQHAHLAQLARRLLVPRLQASSAAARRITGIGHAAAAALHAAAH